MTLQSITNHIQRVRSSVYTRRLWLPAQSIQCCSEISEPKCARKTHIIRVFIHRHTSIDIYAYAYVLIRVCVISMYEPAYCFFYCGKVIVYSSGHCNCSEELVAKLQVRQSSCVYSGFLFLDCCRALHQVYEYQVLPKSPHSIKKLLAK